VKKRIFLSLAVLAAAALPTAANAAGTMFTGVVVAKEAKRGTVVVAARSGVALTVHAKLSAVRVGDHLTVAGTKLRDGTFGATRLRVTGHVTRASVRGVVVRRLSTRTLVSTGRSVIAIRRRVARRALASRGLTPGSVVEFAVSLAGGVARELSAASVGTTNTIGVEGKVGSIAPFVVDIEGLPVTIGLGSAALPAPLAVGDEVELTVTVDASNVFTLVSVDEFQAAEQQSASGGDQSGAAGDDNEQADQGADDGASTSSSAGDDESSHDGGTTGAVPGNSGGGHGGGDSGGGSDG
jgi:hypothetical protein